MSRENTIISGNGSVILPTQLSQRVPRSSWVSWVGFRPALRTPIAPAARLNSL